MTTGIIERRLWDNAPNNFTDLLDWGGGKISSASPLVWEGHTVNSFTLQIQTPSGWVLCPLNTWIMKIGDSFFIEDTDAWLNDILRRTPLIFQHYVMALQKSALSGIEDPQKWVEERQWIDVNDRLPEVECGSFLVYAPKSFPKNSRCVVAEYYDDVKGFYGEATENFMEDVTHWMPLPEPPK